MIVTRGKVVAAWGDTARTLPTHSVRKSFLSALIGMAVADSKLDTAATLGELRITEKGTTLTANEKSARVVDLLRVRSGVYLPAAGETESMRAERPPRGSHAPGTHWYYNNWDFNALGTIYWQATGEDVFTAIERKLAKPIGMQDYRRPEGRYQLEASSMHPAYFFRISARDLARFGELYLRHGRWQDEQLLSPAWVDATAQSYSVMGRLRAGQPATGYGFMWWTQASAGGRAELRVLEGSLTAAGAGGQRLTVIPRLETVVVHLVDTEAPGPRLTMADWDRLLSEVLAARLP